MAGNQDTLINIFAALPNVISAEILPLPDEWVSKMPEGSVTFCCHINETTGWASTAKMFVAPNSFNDPANNPALTANMAHLVTELCNRVSASVIANEVPPPPLDPVNEGA